MVLASHELPVPIQMFLWKDLQREDDATVQVAQGHKPSLREL